MVASAQSVSFCPCAMQKCATVIKHAVKEAQADGRGLAKTIPRRIFVKVMALGASIMSP